MNQNPRANVIATRRGEELSHSFIEKWVGGAGFGAYCLYKEVRELQIIKKVEVASEIEVNLYFFTKR